MDYKVSIYQPIEVEISGQKYPLRKRNQTMFKLMLEFDKALEAVKDKPYEGLLIQYDQVKALVDAPAAVIDDLDVEQIVELFEITSKVMVTGEKHTALEDKEKNGPKPGDVTAP